MLMVSRASARVVLERFYGAEPSEADVDAYMRSAAELPWVEIMREPLEHPISACRDCNREGCGGLSCKGSKTGMLI